MLPFAFFVARLLDRRTACTLTIAFGAAALTALVALPLAIAYALERRSRIAVAAAYPFVRGRSWYR